MGYPFTMRRILACLMLLSLAAWPLEAAPPARKLPSFELPDTTGKAYRDADFRGDPVVLIVTAPTLSNEDEQRAWADALSPLSRSESVHVLYIQDLEPSWFEEMAREKISEKDEPSREPIILLDENGSVRERFGTPEGETVALLYGPAGELLYVERGEPGEDALQRLREALESGEEPQ